MNESIIKIKTGDHPVLMGIVNVTPDSFSDGGQFFDPKMAVAHGLRLVAEGAKILDIGGESTRPGAAPISQEEEQARVIPVLEGLKDCGATLSIDTRNASTMKIALKAGAGMVNDVSALTYDPDSLKIVANSDCLICLMHMKGDPKTMQDAPVYQDVLKEIYDYLARRIDACAKVGVNRSRIIIDPGIGFGKTLDHNLTILNNIDYFDDLGVPVLLGASRKRFIESLCPGTDPKDRLPGSLSACIAAYAKGIRHFRVHDVAETEQALTVYSCIAGQKQ
jgi:dihydropteroate synthase